MYVISVGNVEFF